MSTEKEMLSNSRRSSHGGNIFISGAMELPPPSSTD